jgi:hypothetical protein
MRVSRLCLLTLFALSIPLVAHAEWVTKELGWRKSSIGPTGSSTGIWVRDTLHAPYPIATSGTADTTADFSINDAMRWSKSPTGTTGIDTAWVAYILIQQDSTGAGAPTVSSLTVEIDGRVGGFGPVVNLARYTQLDSTVTTFVNSAGVYNYVLNVPVRALFGLGGTGGNGPENHLNLFYRMMAYPTLRARISAATGVMSGSLRAFIRYWKGPSFDQ